MFNMMNNVLCNCELNVLTCVGWCWRIRFWSLLGWLGHRNRLLLVPCITLLLRLLRLVRRSSMKPRCGWNHGWISKNSKSSSLLVMHHRLPLLILVSKRVWHFLNQPSVVFILLTKRLSFSDFCIIFKLWHMKRVFSYHNTRKLHTTSKIHQYHDYIGSWWRVFSACEWSVGSQKA